MTASNHTPSHKECLRCATLKVAGEFPPERGVCKICRAEQKRVSRALRESAAPQAREKRLKAARDYIDANRDQVAAYKKKWAQDNEDRLREQNRGYYLARTDVYKDRARQWKVDNPGRRLENNRRWVAENPDKARACDRRNKIKRMTCPIRAAQERTRSLIRVSIRSKGYIKESSTNEIIGCDWDFFKHHIELQFTKGMSWDRIGEIHIDHIVPLSTAGSIEEVIALNHFTNLRPMWAKENLSKGCKRTHLI